MVTRRPVPVKDRKKEEQEVGLCGECAMCEPYYKQSTLTVYGGEPTLGKCPEITDRKVLLSEKGCRKWKKGINNISIN